jgi:DNA-3-methyladenine glycosylase
VHAVAPELIGCTLLVDGVGGRIVEVEAYDGEDPASHGFRGQTERNRSMFGPPGHAYVYRSYGIHWCLNLVCEDEGTASAVLLRAVEPMWGLEQMRAFGAPATLRDHKLTAGPGRLCRALGIDRNDNGSDLTGPDLHVAGGGRVPDSEIRSGVRVGLSADEGRRWRFWVSSPSVSR